MPDVTPETARPDSAPCHAGPPGTRCANCGQPLPQPCPAFCGHCGQETRLRPPTVLEMLQQFGGAYLSTEGALWRTLRLLLLRPGELTVQYLRGRRRHYVLPLRLYLTVSVLVLLLMRTVAQVDVKVGEPPADTPRVPNVQLRLGAGEAGMKDGAFYCQRLPAWMCSNLQQRLDLAPQALARQVGTLGERFLGNIGAAMFVLLPSFALWLQLAYRNRRLHYTEHLVFALHLHAFWFAMLGLMLTGWGWLIALAMLAVPVYAWLALGRVYRDRRWVRALRVLAIGLAQGLALLLATTVLALFTLLV
ncbi:DUF3667 domain-containing protein [Aquabacterium sp. OR-4]|uniref:DUF3667 domain-containing protein n=1 Tax=Aquabacterium sp. OR-4 TaxID=2978127 RepID=UPI0021B2F63D|nr:zinc ribbon domain-containing protein [Aquabacterium sp. OR-4]MDT7834019.1 zinc ribbon domain-containing protein [Aquabacterium sp. OR-4]